MAQRRPGKYIDFDEDGMPIVKYSVPISNAAMTETLRASMQMEYFSALGGDCDDDNPTMTEFEASLEGMTRFEAMAHRITQKAAWGDMECAKFIYDRILGKAAQQINTTNVSMSYQDFLQAQIDADRANGIDPMQVAVIPPQAEPAVEVSIVEPALPQFTSLIDQL